MPDLLAAAAKARAQGLPYLEKAFRDLAALSACKAPTPRLKKPKVVWVTDHKGWCGDRLSKELARQMPEYDSAVAHLGEEDHMAMDADLYIYRNPCWINTIRLPDWAYKRVVCIIESHRALDMGDGKWLPKVRCVVPMTYELMARVKEIPGAFVWHTPIANGVNSKEFYPADEFPSRFVVGCSGNFSAEYYDDHKGFSRYLVPACKLAGVKLDWCGWRGECFSMPGVSGKYVEPQDMAAWYRSLSLFVLMSKSEGCSGVTFEAMASGLPVISTKVGWHGENPSDGIMWADRPKDDYPPKAIDAVLALADKIRMLKKNHDMRVEMGKKNRAFAVRCPHSKIAKQWRPVIDYMLTDIRCRHSK